ncbi:MAG: Fe-S protein assembly co-chaperone HscB [Chitinophagaceae bacterium]|nr:Fe-S protein assembly co-chaperone HscB [Chitinophagaceae bacterium]
MNYFELYNLPVSFQPNKLLVKEKYFELSRKYHPDFYGSGTQEEQQEALEMSALVNKAFKTFSNADATIKYILELKGLIEEEEKYSLPNSFLMEMMELNEEVMEAKMTDDPQFTEGIKLKIDRFIDEVYQEVEVFITAATIDELKEEDFLKVKEYYFKKKYLNRILESLES